MSVIIDFAPETEVRLIQEAERTGMAISDLVRQLVETSLPAAAESSDAWLEDLLSEEDLSDAPPLPLSAMNREQIYEGRG